METASLKNKRLAARIRRSRDRLADRLPDIDPHDMELILWSLLKPKKAGRTIFIRRTGKDSFVW